MNRKGFTLIELLAVITLLAVVMLIGTVSIGGIRQKMNKKMFEEKLTLIIGAAQSWGQDNREELATKKTVSDLISSNYLQTDEKDCSASNKVGTECYVITDNTNDKVINNLEISIYLEYNRAYACIVKSESNKAILSEDNSYSLYSHLNYYC